MSYTRVIIEDLGAYSAVDKDANSKLAGKAIISEQHRLSKLTPRDESVWSKTKAEKELLKRCKARN